MIGFKDSYLESLYPIIWEKGTIMLEILKSLIDSNIPIRANVVLLHLAKADFTSSVYDRLLTLGFTDDSKYTKDGVQVEFRFRQKQKNCVIIIDE